jgi:lipopolysaccharide transport system permease protein
MRAIKTSLNREAERYWDLFWVLVKKEFVLKYKRTYLGFAWSLLNPVLIAALYYVALSVFMRFKMENYPLFLLSAIFPWNWFSASLLMSVTTLTNQSDLIKKVIFPKQFLVLSLICGQLATLICSLPVLAAVAVYSGVKPGAEWLFGIPILIIIQFMIVAGISLAASVMNVFFRDLDYITSLFVNMLFWVTPVIYPLSFIPGKFRMVLALNPMMYLIQSWRDLIMTNTINWKHIGISFITALIMLGLGSWIFEKLSARFDEVL